MSNINGGINICIKELESIYELRSFRLHEEVGGKIAYGEFLVSFSQENARSDFYELTIDISNDSGYSLSITAYAYEIKYNILSMEIKFICAQPDFIKTNLVKSYTSVLDAINSNWSGNFDYPSGADIQCDIHQRSQTGYQLVSNLIKCLRFKSAYGFRCDELFIRDLNDNFDFDIGEQGLSVQLDGISISKSKIKDLSPISEDLDINTSISYSRSFKQVRTEYTELVKNYFINNALIKTLGSYKIPIKYSRFDPQMKIGNILKYQLKDLNFNRFLVYSKDMNWTRGLGITTVIELIGYDWSEIN